MSKTSKSLALFGPVAALSTLGLTGFQMLTSQLLRRWSTDLKLAQPCFFTVGTSVVAGQPLRLAIHAPQGGRLTVARLSERVDQPVADLEIEPISQSGQYDHWNGLEWSEQAVETAHDWQPGLYLVELSSGADIYRQAVAISSPKPQPINVVLATNTWNAYNAFGGLSNYTDTASPWPLRGANRVAKVMAWRLRVGDRKSIPAVPLPDRRPNDRINTDLADIYADPVSDFSHLVRAEWALLRFLDAQGHSYNVFSERDFAYKSGPSSGDLAIFAAHSEYWSAEMMGRFDSYVTGGGKALFVSGNNWYRGVKLLANGLEVVDQRVDDNLIARYLGSGYTGEGYKTSAPYEVADSSHTLFDGLSVSNGDVFGGEPGGAGASGHETDKINLGSGQVDVIAVGQNREGPAFLTWKQNTSGGWVCNFGSVAAAPWLERCEVMGGIANNAIRLAVKSE